MSDLTQFHIQAFGQLVTERGNFNTQWEEAASLIIPGHRNTFNSFGQSNTFNREGQKQTQLQFDSTAAFACQRFSSVIESLVVPQNSIWHRITPVDKTLKNNRAVRLYFDDLTDLLFANRYRTTANFVGNTQQTFLGLGAYGNGVLYVDQPDTTPGLRYRNIHLGEVYYKENHAGIVDTMYRRFGLTARQIVQKFGASTPESIMSAAESATNQETKYEVLHCVYPRDEYNPVRVDSKGMPFASLYIAVAEQAVLREGGFATFPYSVTRYTQMSGELYGRGPAQWVLPAIKVINEEKRTILKQGHRIVDPILLSYDDGVLGSSVLKAGGLNPGGVSKEGRLLVQPLPTGNIAVGEKMMEMEKNVINDAFLVTLFQILIDTPQMTATEVLERAREKGMLLAPVAGRIEAEFLGPMIERELSLLAAQGIWPANVPSILQGAGPVEYKIEYDSPMSRMQRSEKAAGFMRSLDTAANYAKNTGDMSPLDHFNFDEAIPAIIDINGAPVAWTRSIEDVQKIRADRAQQQQQQQLLQAAPAIASVAKGMPPQ